MNTLFQKIGAVVVGMAMTVGGWLGYVPEQNVGGSTKSTDVIALFETTLASKITSSATTFTLTSATDKDGNTLASSTYGFIIDEGTASEEFVIADCTATTCTNATRGISARTGTSTVAALQFAHRRGSSVKITDAPALIFAINVMRGRQNLEFPMKYESSVGITTIDDDDRNIANVAYVNSVAFDTGGIVQASETAAGFVELATGLEAASTTQSGTSARLALPTSIATSTYNSATAALKIPVTGNNGKLDSGFISTTTLMLPPTGSIMAYATTTAPNGWLLADGSAVSRTTYSALYSMIGTSYGVGDGATTFNLPDLTGKTIVMASSTQVATSTYSRDTLGDTGGETMHTMTVNEIASHTHDVTGSGGSTAGLYTSYSNVAPMTQTTTATGNTIPFNVLDPYIILNYIIKY